VLGSTGFLVGRDTRLSGPLLQAALSAGLASEGVTVVELGVIPTPGVAALSAERNLPGAMISASHNPFPDNGIKLFARGGRKLPDEVEDHLEAELTAVLARTVSVEPKVAADVGPIGVDGTAEERYVDRLVAALEGRSLDGLRVVLDCANGAASEVAAAAFHRAGARLAVIHAEPDGTNINRDCGSTHPETLCELMRSQGDADIGLAFDGDADRVLAVDHLGNLIDGDQVIALCAFDLRERGLLADDTVVVTVMTNLGFRLAMAKHGVTVVETRVGDRYVLEALEGGRWSLGGEQSGHVIFRDLATTGDGILTGLLLADLVVRQGRPLAELASTVMTRLPQVLRNVRVADRSRLEDASEIWEETAAVQAELGGEGRVLLRPSGTEPLVRVMVEAPTEERAVAAADRLCSTVVRVLGAASPG
jgi:phosphoglucosamine mutase